MSHKLNSAIAVIGIDIGKNSFHLVGLDKRGAVVLRQKWSRGQVEARLANLSPCLIGMEACVGAHHLSRKLQALGHDVGGRQGTFVLQGSETVENGKIKARWSVVPGSGTGGSLSSGGLRTSSRMPRSNSVVCRHSSLCSRKRIAALFGKY
jgi:Protein of unknown function (DUF3224)